MAIVKITFLALEAEAASENIHSHELPEAMAEFKPFNRAAHLGRYSGEPKLHITRG